MIKYYAGWPGKVVAGEGALAAIGDEVKALGGKRAAVFSDGFVSTLPLVTQAMDNMKAMGLEVMMFNRIGPNPTDAMVMDGVEEAAVAGIEAVEQFCRDMGIPKYLDELGVEKEKVPAMAITALEDGVGATNPIQTTVKECEEVFYKCFSK